MFELGSITGLFDSQIKTVQQTSKSIGDVIDDMAKTATDIPMSMLAPMKSVAVATGCFSEATVTKVTTEEDNKAVAAAAAAEAASAAAAVATDAAEAVIATTDAVATESADGAKSPEVSNKSISLNAFNKKTTLGGRMDKSRDPRSGSNLAHLPVAKKPTDVVRSAYLAAKREQLRQEQTFKRQFCDQAPYPECALCPYATRTIYVESDLDKLLRQLETVIGLLVKGLYGLSAGFFQCPGQMRAMLTGNYFPFGEVVVASAMSALSTLVAVRGALKHFEGIVASVRYTDFRGELMRQVKTLFKSGALIGMPKAFTSEIGRLLKDIGYSANNVAKMVSGKTPAKGTRYGKTFSVYGDHSYNSKLIDGYYRTAARRAASVVSVAKANATLKAVAPAMNAAATMAADPSIVAKNPDLADATSTTKEYAASTDTSVQPGVTYKVANPNAKGTDDKYVDVKELVGELPPGASLDTVRALYGDIFVEEDTGVSRPDPIKNNDTVAVVGKIYYIKDPITGKFIQIPNSVFPVGTSIDFTSVTSFEDIAPVELREALRAMTESLGIPLADFLVLLKDLYVGVDSGSGAAGSISGGPGISFTEVDEETPIAGVEYYKIDTDPDSPTKGTFIVLTFDEEHPEFPEGIPVYIKTVAPAGTEKCATPYSGSGACVLDNGLVVAVPEILDAESYRMAIDTKSLVTVTGVLAGDMATIEDIGLSAYEIKMAYLLDHERNGSIMPDDVVAKMVPTILDELTDD